MLSCLDHTAEILYVVFSWWETQELGGHFSRLRSGRHLENIHDLCEAQRRLTKQVGQNIW